MMSASLVSCVRTMPDWRAAWQCSPAGFVAVCPLNGSRAVLAVGKLTHASPNGPDGSLGRSDPDLAREQMRAMLHDRALVEGHDATALFHRVNAGLSTAHLGQIDALALLTRAGHGVPPDIVAVGRPRPLIVTPDGVSAPVEGTVALAGGWAVVIGAALPTTWHEPVLLAPADVATAMSLFTKSSTPGAPIPTRTLLAVVIDD